MNKRIKFINKIFDRPITCLTAYSGSVAKILDGKVDMILIGDSLGSTLYDMKNTQGVTLDMMKIHGRLVTQKIKKSITIIDMPYKTYRNKNEALKNAKSLINFTKAKVLKIEISDKNLPIISYLSKRKFNIIAHIGVTPQSYTNFSKIKILGRKDSEKNKLLNLALSAEKAGAKAVLLECVIKNVAKEITYALSIPTIGIGSSNCCDGQVLVFDDLININSSQKTPKFVKKYLNFERLAGEAVLKFTKQVKQRSFPNKKYSYQ